MADYTIALYIRLSVEDEKTESLSIPNQRLILREKAMSLPEWNGAEILEFIDNGHTGTNFERPAVQKLLELANLGKINCIMVKDLSRFGRNSIETGYFIEKVFPLYHIRFIAVSDNFDSAELNGDTGGVDMAFKYLINECYSRDMSMKSKSAKLARCKRGEYQSVEIQLADMKHLCSVVADKAKTAQEDYEESIKNAEIAASIDGADSLTKALVDKLVERVYVFPNNRIEIKYATRRFM